MLNSEATIEKLTDIKAIKIVLNGALDIDSRKSLHLNTMSLLSIYGYQRLIIDCRDSELAENYSIGDSIKMIKYMQNNAFQKNIKIAFICNEEDGPRKDFVNIARLSGIDIRHFSDLIEAKTWLLD